MVDSIEANVESASIRVNEGADELRMAERYQVLHFYLLTILILFEALHIAFFFLLTVMIFF